MGRKVSSFLNLLGKKLPNLSDGYVGQSLKGKTPAEACGIHVEGENKWITLIQNASHQRAIK